MAAAFAERRKRRKMRHNKAKVFVKRIALESNALKGAIPGAVLLRRMPHLRTLQAHANRLSGWLPHAMGSWKHLLTLFIEHNAISGPIPDAVGSITAIEDWNVQCNILSGFIPDAMGFMANVRELWLNNNALSGPLAGAGHSWTVANSMRFSSNKLSGLLPDVVASWTQVSRLLIDDNRLTGIIPDGLPPSYHLSILIMDHNQLAGSVPGRLLTCLSAWIHVNSNQLRGSIDAPGNHHRSPFSLSISQNQLAGPLPRVLQTTFLVASANMFEGTVPPQLMGHVRVLGISGEPGEVGGLIGPLPRSISKSQRLHMLVASHHRLEGVVPPLHSTLTVLSLHNNLFKALSDVHLESKRLSSGGVLMHNNFLSCRLPVLGNSSVGISLCGLGNQLSRPEQGFPAWVSPVERDKLLWIANKEVSRLALKLTAASTCAALASMVRFRGPNGLLNVMSGWRTQAGAQLALRCSQLLSSLSTGALWRIFFLTLLLSWDLYKCPRFLALASAYLRDKTFIRALVVVMWGYLGFNQSAARWLSAQGQRRDADAKPKSGKKRRRPALLYMLLTLLVSLPAIMFQVGNSVPGSFRSRGWVVTFITAFIGCLQGLLGGLVLPRLAEKLTSHKHVYTTMANLLTSYVFPAAVITYLDTACLGHWVTHWDPCVHGVEQFRVGHHWEEVEIEGTHRLTVMSPEEVCSPSYARGQTSSMSHCMELTLLRLQDIWLGKLITSGLLIPAGRMSADYVYKDQHEIVGKWAILLANAIIASGHLPLMIPLLLLAMVSETLLAAMSWSGHQFKKFSGSGDGSSVARPSLIMAQVSAAIVHFISASGSALALAMVNVLLVSGKVGMSGLEEADTRKRNAQLPSELSEAVSHFSRGQSPGDSSKATSEFGSSSARRK